MDNEAVPQTGAKADARRQAIEEAAYRVLVRDGYKAASILAIAKEAKASNETLYRWYGNKQGLFVALVERTAESARDLLNEALASHTDPLAVLEKLGPVLLRVVTSERAVAINRAAAGDVYDTGTLGEALAKGGRDSLLPLIADVLTRAHTDGSLVLSEMDAAAEIYIDLLVGDVQVRRVTGALGPLSEEAIVARSTRALKLMRRLYAPA